MTGFNLPHGPKPYFQRLESSSKRPYMLIVGYRMLATLDPFSIHPFTFLRTFVAPVRKILFLLLFQAFLIAQAFP